MPWKLTRIESECLVICLSIMSSVCPFIRVLQELRSLVAMNENLKKQETQFKAHCKVMDGWMDKWMDR